MQIKCFDVTKRTTTNFMSHAQITQAQIFTIVNNKHVIKLYVIP